jgi:hypothetical protein
MQSLHKSAQAITNKTWRTTVKVTYTSASGRMTFEFEADTPKAIFGRLAIVQEIFEEEACGAYKSKLIQFDVREYDGNAYYKMVCKSCGAQIDYGQHKDGKGLLIKRLDKDKNPIGKSGWYVYQRKDGYS